MSEANIPHKQGYDAVCHTRDEDHLNRWPLAKEIYRIAVDGPEDWSVRIGIYGEWGSGKSSVLSFIESMAKADDHIVFHFNPWQYHSKDELWKAFVSGLFKQIETELGETVKGQTKRSAKKIGAVAAGAIPSFIGAWNKGAGDATKTGLGLLQHYLVFSAKDLAELKSALNGKRLLISIDDLDRTDGVLVPEILYALKEIMDVPGLAFICAFDPVVVGKVLGKAHPGHEDGLKFLEKIIDYPRWLPAPTDAQLLKLAQVEASKVCPFVPPEQLAESIPTLPRNPRSIRQFIRILALLKPQIERHHPWELQWPIILAANVFKVRFPQLAQSTFSNHAFWESIYQATLFTEKEEEQTKQALAEFIETLDGTVRKEHEDDIRRCIEAIVSKVDAWTGIYGESLQYQFHLAESPHAITWKEFDAFFEACSIPDENQINQWGDQHIQAIEEQKHRVINELLASSISRRKQHLDKAANTTTKKELNAQMMEASKSLKIIQVLIAKTNGAFLKNHFDAILDQIAEYFSWENEPKYRVARREEKKFLFIIFDMNSPDWQIWIEIIGLHPWHRDRGLDRPEWKKFEAELREALRDRTSLWLIESFFTIPNFLRSIFSSEENGNQLKSLFLDPKAPIWTTHKKKFLKQLKGRNPDLQHNCYRLLSSLLGIADGGLESSQAKELLADKELITSLWKQCLSNPLNPRMVGSLRISRDKLTTEYKIECPVPKWWDRTCAELDCK
ncbi:MAG: hypothetical protein H7A51_06225 [Akkermansiaceae bacterium]|nr:hypothetical protein [Akkermansiaceae bacterium]